MQQLLTAYEVRARISEITKILGFIGTKKKKFEEKEVIAHG